MPVSYTHLGLPKKGVPEDRLLRKDWGGQPEWRPDEQGVVRNNDYFCLLYTSLWLQDTAAAEETGRRDGTIAENFPRDLA